MFCDEYADEQHDEAVRRHHELQVSNEVFRSVFDDLLERYNFTIQEDSPTNFEVAIDRRCSARFSRNSFSPARKARQRANQNVTILAVTTPAAIVHYLCRDSLAHGWKANRPSWSKRIRQSVCANSLHWTPRKALTRKPAPG